MAEKKEGNGYQTFKENFSEKIGAVKKSWKNLVDKLFSSDRTEGASGYKFPNIAFYNNEIPAYPLKETIEDILEKWRGEYNTLETNFLYIQWLFPNRKPGINSLSCVLKDKEVEVISSTPEFRERLRRAFEMMLDFYGMKLTEDDQFELSENPDERLKQLNEGRYNHNYLRITRILLALKELGYKHLMLPWLKFMANLVFREKVLNSAVQSFEKFWINTLDEEDSALLSEYLEELKLMKPTEMENGTLINTPAIDTTDATPNDKDESKAESNLPDNSTTVNSSDISPNPISNTLNTAPETEPVLNEVALD